MLGRILTASEADPFRSGTMMAELVRGIIGVNVHTSESTDRNPVTIPIANEFMEFWQNRNEDPRFQIEVLVDMARGSSPEFEKARQKFVNDCKKNGKEDLLSRLEDAIAEVRVAGVPVANYALPAQEQEDFGAWFYGQLEGRRVN